MKANAIPQTGRASATADWSARDIAAVAVEIIRLGEDWRAMKAEWDAKRAALRELHEAENVGAAFGPNWTSQLVQPPPRRKLSREKLIEAGVPIATIDAAYEETEATPYVTVKPRLADSEGSLGR